MDDGSLHEAVMERGRLFASIFYLSFLVFMLSHGIGAVSLLMASSPFFVLDLGLIAVAVLLIRRRDLYLMLYLTFVFPLIAFLFMVSLLLPMIAGEVSIYVSMGAVSFVSGALTAFVFRKTSESDLKFLAPGILVSLAIALVAGMITAVRGFFRQLYGGYAVSEPSMLVASMAEAVSPHRTFALLLLTFNVAFLYYCWEYGRNYRVFTLYL
ncbi:MAG: hypothetical protein SVU32_00550, partial [Candidatus Nanohaloarchaea archaeon]|nr:hypothetical protein [Candidatus Nanohaloarchaea archaeon]